MGFTRIAVQSTHLNADGSLPWGKITFALNAAMTNADEVISPSVITAVVGSANPIVIVLFANDDTGTAPASPGAAYGVLEELNSQAVVSYSVIISKSATITDAAASFTNGSAVVGLSNVLACSEMVGHTLTDATNFPSGVAIIGVNLAANTVTVASNAGTTVAHSAVLGGAVDLSTLAHYASAPSLTAFMPWSMGQTDGETPVWNASTGAWVPAIGAGVAAETTRAENAEALLIPLSQKGAASGVAALDANSNVVYPIEDKGGQVFNVKAFGAVADVVIDNIGGFAGTDNTAHFQACIDAIVAANTATVPPATTWCMGEMYIPPGDYRINSPLLRIPAGLKIRGAGSVLTHLFYDPVITSGSVMFNLATFTSTPANPYIGTIDSCTFEGFSVSVPNLGWPGDEGNRTSTFVQDNGNGGHTFKDIDISGFKFGIASPYGGDFNTYHDVNVGNCDYGIYVGPGSQQLQFYSVVFGACKIGLFIEGALQGSGYGCTFGDSAPANATLTTALTSGTAYTALAVTALLEHRNIGDDVWVESQGWYQVFTASAAASVGATSISVTSKIANFSYPIGSFIDPGHDIVVNGGAANPLTYFGLTIGGSLQYSWNLNDSWVESGASASNRIPPSHIKFLGSARDFRMKNTYLVSGGAGLGYNAFLDMSGGDTTAMDGLLIAGSQIAYVLECGTAGYPGVRMDRVRTVDGHTPVPLVHGNSNFAVFNDPDPSYLGHVSNYGAMPLHARQFGDTADRISVGPDGTVSWSHGNGDPALTLALNSSNQMVFGGGNGTLFNKSVGTAVAGAGLVVAEGANAKQGVATLSSGTVVVANTHVTANSRIILTAQSLGTVTVPSALCISARTPGTSFTILASQATDTSVIAFEIFESGW